ncbi:MAG: DUF2892 domain-containing protein [Candidatus Methanoperedens sp.]|nr:DUF2892 domain-containing protein [Candidatus Methanoperedens sp.]
MEINIGTNDRIVRVVIGILLLYAVATGMVFQEIAMYVFGFVGFMMLFTAVLAYCPLYLILNMNTATLHQSQN